MQNGQVLYENIGDQHMALLPLLLAPLRLLVPDGLQLAKLVLVALISLSTLLTFLAGKRTAGWLGGLLAAVVFVAWSPAFTFGKLWHETFLAPLYLLLLTCSTTLRRPGARSKGWSAWASLAAAPLLSSSMPPLFSPHFCCGTPSPAGKPTARGRRSCGRWG